MWMRAAGAVASLMIGSVGVGQSLPPGFEITTVASGFLQPVAATIAGDGRIFVVEQRGMVWVVQNGTTLPTPFINLTDEVQIAGERGMMGIALDPDFLDNHFVYLAYVVD